MELEAANSKENSRQLFEIVKSVTRKFQPRLQCIQSATGENLTEAAQIADRWKGYCEDLYHDKEENVGSKSLHHFVQRLHHAATMRSIASISVATCNHRHRHLQHRHYRHCRRCCHHFIIVLVFVLTRTFKLSL